MTDPDNVTFREGLAFLAPLIEQSARDLAFTTNSLIDSLAMILYGRGIHSSTHNNAY